MKDTIYTIPLTDAFKAEDECPFCFLHKKLEEDAISFTLGASYMEDDIRAVTDKMGFCQTHYKKLYDYGNRLGLALILHTHYKEIGKQLDKILSSSTLPSASFLQKLTKSKSSNSTDNPLVTSLHTLNNNCYICDRINKDLDRYMETFFYLLSSNPEFEALFTSSKGFCLHHFTQLIEVAPLYLKEADKVKFVETSKSLLSTHIKRIEDEISWFIDKYDYRNNNAPWKNSKDAIPRGIQKLSGIYVQTEPFTQK